MGRWSARFAGMMLSCIAAASAWASDATKQPDAKPPDAKPPDAKLPDVKPQDAKLADPKANVGLRVNVSSKDAVAVPQPHDRLEALRKTLTGIKLPEGFRIEPYALVPGARHMAVLPKGEVILVGTRMTRAYAVAVPQPGAAETLVKEFASTIAKLIPNGPCVAADGTAYIVEQNRVLSFKGAERFFTGEDVNVQSIVAQGELIPRPLQSFHHSARVCRIGPDDKLYIALGEPFNVTPATKLAEFNQWGIGGIIRLDRDGSHREVFARGIRFSVGMDFNPADKSLWFTDNQVDGMGDDQPPGEINRATAPGQDFGFPWYGGGHVRTTEYASQTPPAGAVFPMVEETAHAADAGLMFYRGDAFPAKYRGSIFSVQHGSWNRTVPVGARIMFTPVKADGTADHSEVFAEGWLTPTGKYVGRPVDVAQLPDGSLLVSDDEAGALYRISYAGK